MVDGSTKWRGRRKLTLEGAVLEDLGLLDITKQDALDRAQWSKWIHVVDLN